MLTCVDRPLAPNKYFPAPKEHIYNHDVILISDILSKTGGNYPSSRSNCNERLLNSTSKEEEWSVKFERC
jgi:hypothetical protein